MKRKRQRNNPGPRPTSEEIATTAYHLYAESGFKDGYDLEHWLRAEQLLTERLKSTPRAHVAGPEPAQVSERLESPPKPLGSESPAYHYSNLKQPAAPRSSLPG